MEEREYAVNQGIINNAIRTLGIIKPDKGKKENPLTLEIKSSLEELDEVRQYFDFVNEPELVEYAIYKEKAIIQKLSFLIKKAKLENVKVNSQVL